MAEAKVVCLVSGGIDSPVAAWLIISKGYEPVFVFYDNYPFTGENTKQRAIDAVKKLKQHTAKEAIKLYIIPHGEDLADILRNCQRRLTCILCRRMMYRLGKKVAEIEDAEAIVTGEIIGEHASQTLRNLRVENTAAEGVSVLRPLLCFDKHEVEKLARKIGTFDVSTRAALCCSAPPKTPRTFARIAEVVEAEKKLNIDFMIERNMKGCTVTLF